MDDSGRVHCGMYVGESVLKSKLNGKGPQGQTNRHN